MLAILVRRITVRHVLRENTEQEVHFGACRAKRAILTQLVVEAVPLELVQKMEFSVLATWGTMETVYFVPEWPFPCLP